MSRLLSSLATLPLLLTLGCGEAGFPAGENGPSAALPQLLPGSQVEAPVRTRLLGEVSADRLADACDLGAPVDIEGDLVLVDL